MFSSSVRLQSPQSWSVFPCCARRRQEEHAWVSQLLFCIQVCQLWWSLSAKDGFQIEPICAAGEQGQHWEWRLLFWGEERLEGEGCCGQLLIRRCSEWISEKCRRSAMRSASKCWNALRTKNALCAQFWGQSDIHIMRSWLPKCSMIDACVWYRFPLPRESSSLQYTLK